MSSVILDLETLGMRCATRHAFGDAQAKLQARVKKGRVRSNGLFAATFLEKLELQNRLESDADVRLTSPSER